jgi:CHAT domain-containing protein/tetratricopeptide (TPR) repeat protein
MAGLVLLPWPVLPPTPVWAASSPAEAEAEALLSRNGAEGLDRAIDLLGHAVAEGNLPAIHKLAMALDRRGQSGDLRRARELLLNRKQAFEAALGADHEQMASYLRALAFVSNSLGLSKEALAAAREARAHVVALARYDLWVAQIDTEIGIYLEDLGLYGEALASMSGALAVIEKRHGRNHSRTGTVHNNMAIVFESMSDYGNALKHYKEALRIALRNDGPRHIGVAELYANIGGVLDRLGRSGEGLKLFEKATPIFIAVYGPHHPNLGRHLADMATLEVSLQRYPEALARFDDALPMLIDGFGEKSKFVAAVQFNRANTLMQLGRSDDALQSYAKANAAFAEIYGADSQNVAMVEVETAGALADTGRNAEALALYTKALETYRAALGEENFRTGLLYNALGIVNVNLENYAAATVAFGRALAIKVALVGPTHPDAADIMSNQARALAESGQVAEAIGQHIKALAIYVIDPERNLDPMRKNYLGLAERLKKSGNRRAATLFAKLAVNAHQDLRLRNAALPPHLERSLARSMKPAYDLLVEQQISDGAFAEAQYASSLIKTGELIAFSRGNAGIEQKAGAKSRLSKRDNVVLGRLSKILAPSTATGRDIQKLIDRRRTNELTARDSDKLPLLQANFEAQAREATTEAIKLFASLETGMQEAQQLELRQSAKQAGNLQETLSKLGPGVVLYQAIALDNGLQLFVTAAGQETVHREVAMARAELATKVYEAVNLVEQRDPLAIAKLQDLHAVLIEPVAEDLRRRGASVVMLDLGGFLRYVPYAALNANGRYLVEDYALALYTSAVPPRFALPDRTAATGAGFGVSKGADGFAPLPGVERELEDIFTGADRTGTLDGAPLLDEGFNMRSFSAALRLKPQYIHIASHFKFEPGNETRSFLLLGEGGALTLADLRSDKKLSFKGVDLLTLSACETARGGGSEGEEIESFGALAQSKGASAVMATLWQIADQSTARLMSDFYEGLLSQGLDKARALQRAQIAMLRGLPAVRVTLRSERGVLAAGEEVTGQAPSTAHPYYWSAFILMGNWL